MQPKANERRVSQTEESGGHYRFMASDPSIAKIFMEVETPQMENLQETEAKQSKENHDFEPKRTSCKLSEIKLITNHDLKVSSWLTSSGL